jgi:hypothetical protein
MYSGRGFQGILLGIFFLTCFSCSVGEENGVLRTSFTAGEEMLDGQRVVSEVQVFEASSTL